MLHLLLSKHVEHSVCNHTIEMHAGLLFSPQCSMCHVFRQVDKYKYLVWVPGNCASVRLALQLASDAAVLKVCIIAL